MNGWWEDAACRGQDTDRFFGSGEMSRRVRATCGACPVRPECLADALRTEIVDYLAVGKLYGVRGGMLPSQRLRILRNQGLRATSQVGDDG